MTYWIVLDIRTTPAALVSVHASEEEAFVVLGQSTNPENYSVGECNEDELRMWEGLRHSHQESSYSAWDEQEQAYSSGEDVGCPEERQTGSEADFRLLGLEPGASLDDVKPSFPGRCVTASSR